MPKSDEHVQFSNKQDLLTPKQKLAIKIFGEFQKTFRQSAEKNQNDPVTHSQMSVVALSQLAAIVAVDVGMQPDQFINVCRCNFEEAFKNAPRFA